MVSADQSDNEGSYDPNAEDDDVDETGGAPPDSNIRSGSKATQFGSGQKSNRSGRPRVPKDRKQTIRRIAAKRRVITIEGHAKRHSYLEIVLLQIRNAAISGNIKALRVFEKLVDDMTIDEHGKVRAVFFAPEKLADAQEFEAHAKAYLEKMALKNDERRTEYERAAAGLGLPAILSPLLAEEADNQTEQSPPQTAAISAVTPTNVKTGMTMHWRPARSQ